jgi:hypothetical protein
MMSSKLEWRIGPLVRLIWMRSRAGPIRFSRLQLKDQS